jgi:hypothetical protein
VYSSRKAVPPPPLRILFAESLVQQAVTCTKKEQKIFEKELEKYITLQDHLAKLEEESKGEKIREASYFQQQAVLQVRPPSSPLSTLFNIF